MNDYGPLAGIVAYSAAIIAAGTAITVAWRGRHRWAPVQEELKGGAEKGSVLAAAVIIVVLYVTYGRGDTAGPLTAIALGCAGGTLIILILYQYFFGRFTFLIKKGKPDESRVVGGAKLTPRATQAMKDGGFDDPEELLPGLAYDPGRVWDRASRERVKTLLSTGYALLLLVGTVALGSAAIRLSRL